MTVPPRIIALCGPKTCGKDTVAKGLLNQNNQVHGKYIPIFKKTPFAAGPKTICHQVFGWSYEDMEDPVFKETPLTEWPFVEPRWPMMDIANWMRDKYGPDVWVNVLKNRLPEIERTDRHGAYIITDLRFPNEIRWLKSSLRRRARGEFQRIVDEVDEDLSEAVDVDDERGALGSLVAQPQRKARALDLRRDFRAH